jgi:lipopolysaccharide/colanic/teichoic acid biosynthesis glycosyltransferase
MYKSIFKRILDLFVSLVGFIVLLPVFFIIAVLLLIDLRGNPFFFQVRPGKRMKLFTLVKFRTMNEAKDAAGNLLPDAERVTSLGKVLRKTSLDEIPQLLNVIIGDMSLVGPRPLLTEYLPLYNASQARRHEVLPGITGWAQVNGRNMISWKSKFEYDCWYVDHISFGTDIRIIFLTLKKVVEGDGVNAGNQVTMEKFTGTPNT